MEREGEMERQMDREMEKVREAETEGEMNRKQEWGSMARNEEDSIHSVETIYLWKLFAIKCW